MNATLPGGKGHQANTVTVNPTKPATGTRVVKTDRLEKMTNSQLEAKISNLPNKIKRKSDGTSVRIAKLRESLQAYENFKRAEADACKLILEKRKKTPAPNAIQPKAA